MADLSSIQTTAQNIVQAINKLATTYLNVEGQTTQANITGNASLVMSGPGRLCRVSVTTAGNSSGTIYDSNSVALLTRPIYTIGNSTGIVNVSLPVGYGLVVVPGGGNQTLAVSYS